MISYQHNMFSDKECKEILNLWDEKQSISNQHHSDRAVAMRWMELTDSDIKTIHNGGFSNKEFSKIRLQYNHESLGQVDTYHGHRNIYNYIIYLNDDYLGGEIEFENGLTIKPTRGGLLYFDNNEHHRIRPCVGYRWAFTALGDRPAEIQYPSRARKLI